MQCGGTDKPDLRNPLIIKDITKIFKRADVKFDIFKSMSKGSKVRCIITKNTKTNQEAFDNVDKWAKEQGASGSSLFHSRKNKYLKKRTCWKILWRRFS